MFPRFLEACTHTARGKRTIIAVRWDVSLAILAALIVMDHQLHNVIAAVMGIILMGLTVSHALRGLIARFAAVLLRTLVNIASRLIISLITNAFHAQRLLLKAPTYSVNVFIPVNLASTFTQTAPATPHATPDSLQQPYIPEPFAIFPVQGPASVITMALA